MGIVRRYLARCDQCGHEWMPEKRRPRRCAKCKSMRWNVGVRLEPDGQEGAVVPSPDHRENELGAGEICGRAPGGDQPSCPAEAETEPAVEPVLAPIHCNVPMRDFINKWKCAKCPATMIKS